MRKVDYHIHSKFSDGQQTILELVKRAKAIGLESIAITIPIGFLISLSLATGPDLV